MENEIEKKRKKKEKKTCCMAGVVGALSLIAIITKTLQSNYVTKKLERERERKRDCVYVIHHTGLENLY